MQFFNQMRCKSSIFLTLIWGLGFIQPWTIQIQKSQYEQPFSSFVIKSDRSSQVIGSFDSLYNFLVIKLERKNRQDLQLVCGNFTRLIRLLDTQDDSYKVENQARLLCHLRLIRKYILKFILLLFCPQYDLYPMNDDHIPEEQSISQDYFSCIASNVRSLPVTLATNLAGNGVANAIALLSPSPLVAGGSACAVGCIGGCLEAYSSDTQYMSQDTIDLHRNFKTGFVADAVCVPVGSCFKTVISNAAAIGAPVGYCTGLGTGLLVRHCCQHRLEKQRHQPVIALTPIDRE